MTLISIFQTSFRVDIFYLKFYLKEIFKIQKLEKVKKQK